MPGAPHDSHRHYICVSNLVYFIQTSKFNVPRGCVDSSRGAAAPNLGAPQGHLSLGLTHAATPSTGANGLTLLLPRRRPARNHRGFPLCCHAVDRRVIIGFHPFATPLTAPPCARTIHRTYSTPAVFLASPHSVRKANPLRSARSAPPNCTAPTTFQISEDWLWSHQQPRRIIRRLSHSSQIGGHHEELGVQPRTPYCSTCGRTRRCQIDGDTYVRITTQRAKR